MWRDHLVHREVLGTIITAWSCPDCDFETYHIDGNEHSCIEAERKRERPVDSAAVRLAMAKIDERHTS